MINLYFGGGLNEMLRAVVRKVVIRQQKRKLLQYLSSQRDEWGILESYRAHRKLIEQSYQD